MALPYSTTWSGIAWNGSVYCAVGSGAQCATSTDGINWTARDMPSSADWNDIAWNGSVFCAVAGLSNKAATSADGITWTARTLTHTGAWNSIVWTGSLFVAVGHTSYANTSADGVSWGTRSMPSTQTWKDVAWNGSVLCAIASSSSTCATSSDGLTWTSRSMGTSSSWSAIAASSSGFVVVAGGQFSGRYSADGITWSYIELPYSTWYNIAWDGSQFVASGTSNYATGNADGSSWTGRTTMPSGFWIGLIYADGQWVATNNGTTSAISDDGITWATSIDESGEAIAYTELTVYESGEAVCYTELTVDYSSGTATAHTALTVTGEGEAVAYTALAVISPTHQPRWRARCILGGVDVSDQLVGQASVEADEGAARIASVVLQPDPGTIAPLDYVGQTISLDYVLVIAGVDVPRRIFTGLVDTPSYDAATTLLSLDCVDDLQNRVALMDRATLDTLIGGKYSEAVQGEIDDNWDYAQALLTTVPASLDASAAGGMRVTDWDLATTWATYDEGDLLYQQASLTLPQRSTLTNEVAVEFAYRYPRLRQRYTSIGWSGTQADMLKVGYAYPKQQDIAGAAGGSGWQIVTQVFWPAPAAIPHSSGGFIYPDPGSVDMAVIFLAQRHAQTVTETYSITVFAPESITLNGTLPATVRGALASEFDGRNWESALDIEPLLAGGEEQDYSPDAPRADADHAIETLLDQARVKILGSHRSARVSNAVLCNPDLDLDKRIEIDTASMAAEGKVARVAHRLDFDAGSAITEFDIAIHGAGGAGIITPDTLDPPTPPDEAEATHVWQADLPSLTVSVYGSTSYTEDLMGLLLNPPETITVEDVPGEGTVTYDNPYYVAGDGFPVTGFRVRMPGVDDADRDPLEKPTTASYQIIIPSDPLTFTVL